MNKQNSTAFLQIDIASGKQAPAWVELFPAGPQIKARDGRAWTLEDPQTVVAAFTGEKMPLAIDYEHAQFHKARSGNMAPAAGWITALEIRDGAVWGKTEWTAKAAEMIVAREYRFISPEFNHGRDGQISRLKGAGLVNRPALEMTALSSEQENDTMDLKALAKALGLLEDSDEATIVAAANGATEMRDAICTALEIATDSKPDAINTALASLKDKAQTALASAKDAVPKTELTAVAAELTASQARVAALEKKDHARDVDGALNAAASEGKITPASRDQYTAMCATVDGLAQFKSLVETLPVICAPSDLDGKTATTAEANDDLDPVAIAAQANQYQREQDKLGIAVSIEDAVDHVTEKVK